MSRVPQAKLIHEFQVAEVDLSCADYRCPDSGCDESFYGEVLQPLTQSGPGSISGLDLEPVELNPSIRRTSFRPQRKLERLAERRKASSVSSQVISILDLMIQQGRPTGVEKVASSLTVSFALDSTVSARGQQQMQGLLECARSQSQGRSFDVPALECVAGLIDQVGYGAIPKGGFSASIPAPFSEDSGQLAEYLKQANNATALGLRKLNLDNPNDAPPGAIVLVRSTTLATKQVRKEGISVRGEENYFYNGCKMIYKPRHNYKQSSDCIVDIYVPL